LPVLQRANRRSGVAVTDRRHRVGTVGFPVSKDKLYPHVDWVEVNDTYATLPKTATAKRWREEAPAHVDFAVQLPRFLFDKPSAGKPLKGTLAGYGGFRKTEENRKLFEHALRLADTLKSSTLVLLTPGEFTPTQNHQDALADFLRAMPLEGRGMVWQPSGPWEYEQAARLAKKLGITLAVDPLRDEPPRGDLAYCRLGPFAALGSRVGLYDLERIAEATESFKRAVVVFETRRALDDARNLKRALEGGGE
jgi:uncharacterized protein YecE (DUF72 family)